MIFLWFAVTSFIWLDVKKYELTEDKTYDLLNGKKHDVTPKSTISRAQLKINDATILTTI